MQYIYYSAKRHFPNLSWHIFESIDSTQKFLDKAYDKKQTAICCASLQTQAIGQRGKNWIAPSNTGLWFSLAAIPCKINLPWSIILGAEITQLLKNHHVNAQIKWPNDIYIGDKKCAGILVETYPTHLIVGIGINLKTHVDLPNTSTTIGEIDCEKFFIELIQLIQDRLKLPEPSWITIANSFLYRKNQKILFSYQDKKITGVLRGINPSGGIIIENSNNLHEFYHGRFISF